MKKVKEKTVIVKFRMDEKKYREVLVAAKSWGHKSVQAYTKALLTAKLGKEFWKGIR